tara:strand:+ start:3116 stop:3421 length:306 start_codon:yes stop_codon:yes gene_type:complete
VGLGGPAIEEVGDLDSVDRMDPEGQRVQAVEDQAAEEADDPASVGRMDPEGQRDQVVPAAEGPGSEAKAVEALDLVDRADRVVEALEAAGRSEHHPARVCP